MQSSVLFRCLFLFFSFFTNSLLKLDHFPLQPIASFTFDHYILIGLCLHFQLNYLKNLVIAVNFGAPSVKASKPAVSARLISESLSVFHCVAAFREETESVLLRVRSVNTHKSEFQCASFKPGLLCQRSPGQSCYVDILPKRGDENGRAALIITLAVLFQHCCLQSEPIWYLSHLSIISAIQTNAFSIQGWICMADSHDEITTSQFFFHHCGKKEYWSILYVTFKILRALWDRKKMFLLKENVNLALLCYVCHC